MEYILASASPRRQELLHNILKDFLCLPADIEEITPENIPTTAVPEYLAVRKAKAVSELHPESLVIGSDTVVLVNNTILGKPADSADAARMLKLLSGKEHTVITGCALFSGKHSLSFSEAATVCFYPLTDSEIEQYVATGEPMDKAGAYGIQGLGSTLVREIHGDFFTIMGLPVARLKRELQKFEKIINL